MSDSLTHADPAPAEAGAFSRRSFLRSAGIAGAAVGLASCNRPALRPDWKPLRPGRDLQVGLVGCGEQGNALWKAISLIDDNKLVPHIRCVVDIDRTKCTELAGAIQEAGHEGKTFDNIDEMLEKEGKNLHAVILAVPDWIHHELTIKALRAGLHVYCEKMMSNRVEWAREMVRASLETGKLLQIGHQRRSNPRYLALRNGIIAKHQGLGRMTHAYAQWHRGIQSSAPLAVAEAPGKVALAKKNGYGSFHEMRNWRHYRKYGGGIISDLGAHQIDLFNWFFQALPKRLVVTGGVDYWDAGNPRGHYELPDNVMVAYEYEVPGHLNPDGRPHMARAYYQTLTTTGTQGFHERFFGDCATVFMSEVPTWNQIYRETFLDDAVSEDELAKLAADPKDAALKDYKQMVFEYRKRWDAMQAEDLIYAIPYDLVWKGRRGWETPRPFGRQPPAWFKTPKEEDDARRSPGAYVDVRVSKPPPAFGLGTALTMPAHQPHLLNFFAAVEANKKDMLNCPGEEGFRTCVTVLKVYDALAGGGTAEFKPEDFAI